MIHSKLPLKKSTFWEATKNSWGIYKFIQNGRCIYIGSTLDTFEKRARAHQCCQHNHSLAEEMRKGDVVIEPLIIFDKEDRMLFSKYDILELEAKMIFTLKPKYNHQFKHLSFEDQLANDVRVGRYTWNDVEQWKMVAVQPKSRRKKVCPLE